MSETVRIGVSLGMGLLDDFDRLLKKLGYANRSEALRDLIRRKLAEEQWEAPGGDVFAAVFLVYDHHKMSVGARLVDMQHESLARVIGSFHVHMADDLCLEVVVMHGEGAELRDLASRMISLKGVQYGKLNMGISSEMGH
ncbi:MAG: nickel-responsive transcriptional regulator NikR [Planctomycetes bacterium]|nr:nickel-responsive transcriptional regulator NikR [Planctomycetota bacterium]